MSHTWCTHSTQTAKEAPVGNELCSQISLLLPAPVFGNRFTHVSMSKVRPTAPPTGCGIRPGVYKRGRS